MATSSVQLAPGFTLTGSSPSPDSAPINYQLNGKSIGQAINGVGGFQFSGGTDGSPAGTWEISVNGVFIGSGLNATAAETALDSLRSASLKIQSDIAKQVQVAAPAPAPATAPIPVTQPEVQTVTTIKTEDIVINTEPLVIPIIDINTGEVTGNTVVNVAPITIPGETITVEPSTGNAAPTSTGGAQGLSGATATAASAATGQDQANFTGYEDWRVRLALAPGSNYLYNAQGPSILQPLKKTNGVIFPYTPAISVSYAAAYEGSSLTHTNYKIYQYQNSSVEQVTISCDFTAQDVSEANYLLAVIHFFRSMTKMFYGQDNNPKNGTPPPLCYIYGMGGYQFDALPLAISGFNYTLPTDVDYIKTTGASAAGTPQPSVDNGATNPGRLGGRLAPGGVANPPNYGTTPTQSGVAPTWVPTKIQLSITCLPIMSRNQVSNNFSLKDYATGKLLQGTKRKGGGFW